MDFTVSEDRQMLGDSLARLLADRCGFEARNAIAYTAPWHSPDLWEALAELGVFHAFLPEDQGGFGGTGFDCLAVFEGLGRALCPEPVLGHLMGLRLLASAGAETEAAIAGAERLALALDEPDAPWEIADMATTATATATGNGTGDATENGSTWALTGRKTMVYGAQAATRLLVAARIGEAPALFELDPAAAVLNPFGLIDGGGAADMALDGTPARLLMRDAGAALEDALDWGRLALAAEALGAMDAAFAMLTEYLRTRKQFGKPIASFQALQHRCVDLRIEMEQARSLTIRAAGAMGTPGQARAVAQMKTLIGRTARLAAEETIQLQGGIAMTWEYPASHFAKRLVMIDPQLGDADFHLSRLIGGLT